jgi:hypothetical protein
MRMYCLMTAEFQLGTMKKLWRWIVVMLVQHCILNALELVT